ncbi:MAG: hypothetical protein ABIN25_10730, partial [Ginsengibacter sp.]
LFAKDNTEYAGIVLIIGVAAAGAFFVQLNARRQIVQVRKSWGLLSLYLAVALFVPFINNSHSLKYWLLATIPLSAFIASAFFYIKKKWISALLHWVMAAFVIYITYFKT